MTPIKKDYQQTIKCAKMMFSSLEVRKQSDIILPIVQCNVIPNIRKKTVEKPSKLRVEPGTAPRPRLRDPNTKRSLSKYT